MNENTEKTDFKRSFADSEEQFYLLNTLSRVQDLAMRGIFLDEIEPSKDDIESVITLFYLVRTAIEKKEIGNWLVKCQP